MKAFNDLADFSTEEIKALVELAASQQGARAQLGVELELALELEEKGYSNVA